MTSPAPTAPAPLLGEEALEALQRGSLGKHLRCTGDPAALAGSICAALEPLVAALVADRVRAAREDCAAALDAAGAFIPHPTDIGGNHYRNARLEAFREAASLLREASP